MSMRGIGPMLGLSLAALAFGIHHEFGPAVAVAYVALIVGWNMWDIRELQDR